MKMTSARRIGLHISRIWEGAGKHFAQMLVLGIWLLMRWSGKAAWFVLIRLIIPVAKKVTSGLTWRKLLKRVLRTKLVKWIRGGFNQMPLHVKMGLAVPAILTVVVLCAVLLSLFNGFIQPAASASGLDSIGAEYGDEQAYYCKHLDAAKIKPSDWPLICRSADMIADSLPPFSPIVPNYQGDKYDWGNCTYWAALRRAQNGHPVPNTWGDAYEWAYGAARDGYTVDHMPAKGAVMQRSSGLGHVAYVEDVYANGDWRISEMNVIGFNQVDFRTLPASAAGNYYFIH